MKRMLLTALGAAYAVWLGCPPPPATIPPPPAVLAGCFDFTGTIPITIKRSGTTPFTTSGGTVSGKISNTSGTAVTWDGPPAGTTGTLVDGGSAAGTVANPPAAGGSRAINARGTYSTSVGNVTLVISGNITGPPPPCTGSGTWTINNNLRGTWSIP